MEERGAERGGERRGGQGNHGGDGPVCRGAFSAAGPQCRHTSVQRQRHKNAIVRFVQCGLGWLSCQGSVSGTHRACSPYMRPYTDVPPFPEAVGSPVCIMKFCCTL